MANFSHPVPSDSTHLLLDFPLRLYTALQTVRLYPLTNPQVQRTTEFVMQSFRELRKTGDKEWVSLAVFDNKLFVTDRQLPYEDHERLQIQGLIAFFSRAGIHSLSFSPTFSLKDCIRLTQTLATLFSAKKPTMPVASLLNKAGIFSVAVDAEQYVPPPQDEQVARQPPGSKEETGTGIAAGTSKNTGITERDEQVQELINRLSPLIESGKHPDAITESLIDLLQQHRHSQDVPQRSLNIALPADTIRTDEAASPKPLHGPIDQTDSAPLTDILHSKKNIAQAPPGTSREEDLAIWANLTKQLGTEEFRAIYEAFTEQRYRPEQTIVSQGDTNDSLFFINQGSIKVSHLIGPKELFITSLSRGQLAGESFFIPSLWTATLTALTSSRLYLLPQSALLPWQERFPELRTKLYEYYQASTNIGSILRKKGLNRRMDQRFTVARTIHVQPINDQDAPTGRGFRSETADISQGGLAFLVRIARPENARLLLGRRMGIALPVGGRMQHLQLKGMVIGIQPFRQGANDFFVHFRFDHPVAPEELQTILG